MIEPLNLHLNPTSKTIMVHDKEMHFPYEVRRAVIMQDRVIVAYDNRELKESLPDFDYRRAVWCYDLEGNLLWQVDAVSTDAGTGQPIGMREADNAITKDGAAMMAIDYVVYSKTPLEINELLKLKRGVQYTTKRSQFWASSAVRDYDLDPDTGKLSNERIRY